MESKDNSYYYQKKQMNNKYIWIVIYNVLLYLWKKYIKL